MRILLANAAPYGHKSTLVLWLLRVSLCLCLVSAHMAHAAYVSRFNTITNGAITFTGNTIGLNKAASANAPGSAGAIGTFISNSATSVDGSYPVGTTSSWQANASSAVLSIPVGSNVLYAELIWSGSYSYGGEAVTASLGNAVTLTSPLGSNAITPAVATAATIGTAGTGKNLGTCATAPCFYVRSANVTALVQTVGTGSISFTVAGIPATQGDTENNSNTGGWTLAVVYGNSTLPSRSLSLFVGAEVAGSAAASVSGFCTAPTGPRSGRLMVSALEGDAGIAGDQMVFGPTATTLTAQSGPNNLAGNFFASQINNDAGNLDTSGSFGSSNQTPGSASVGRQGYDITNVDVSAALINNQTTAFAQGTTTGDQYLINALGLQINVGSPIFPLTVKQVDKTVTVVGDTLTYTIRLDNTTGTADATNLVFTDTPPAGTSFVAGSLQVDGVANAGNPTAGIALGTIAAGAVKVVSFSVLVNSIPTVPAAALYSNSASWSYNFISCAGQSTSTGSVSTNPVTSTIARLSLQKSVSPTTGATPGSTLTYTITLLNDGTAPSSRTTAQDTVPLDVQYVLASTMLNGIAVPDTAGAMPYNAAALVNSSGQVAGVLAVGQTATVVFKVVVNSSATGTITNTAVGDIDGSGGAPSSSFSVKTPISLIALLSIVKTNAATSVVAGATTTYSITVSNAGPSAAHGAVVKDPPATGLECTALTCSSAGASCPVPLDLPALLSGGLVITSLPANSSLTLQLTCNVTASGL
jgi:large repetitive protein